MALEPETRQSLDVVFHPKSIAVVGISPTSQKSGNLYWQTLKDFNYPGDLFAVGIEGGEIKGNKIYKSILDVPCNVDMVICAIPGKFTPQLVVDCGKKGVKGVHFFTAGFGEVEEEIGQELQAELLEASHKTGVRLIGPNCIGIYNPISKITFASDFSTQPGHVAYIAQSGGQCLMGVREANGRGIYFSTAISYGNAADINECDLIEYFTDDPETEIIVMYIEGTRDGPRMIRALNGATKKKPVIVYKGGMTGGGSGATMSHTGSIAGSNVIWEYLLRQTGVIHVNDLQEMFDVVTVLQRCPEPKGLNVLVAGSGGGASVQAGDEVCRAGLKMPLLPDNLRQKLREIYGSDTGRIFCNPLDINLQFTDQAKFEPIFNWEGIDAILMHANPMQIPWYPRKFAIDNALNTLIKFKGFSSKPMVTVVRFSTAELDDGSRDQTINRLIREGLAIFPTPFRAAAAIVYVYNYYQWRHWHC